MSSRAGAGAGWVGAWRYWVLPIAVLWVAAPRGVAGQSSTAVDRIREADRGVVRVVTHLPGGVGTGSGSVVAEGHVLTNHHVVDGGARHQVVSAHTGGMRDARVRWTSPELDLAVLQVDGLELPHMLLGTMPLRTGEPVWAVGFPGVADALTGNMSLRTTLTRGVIGRLYRSPWDVARGGRALDKIQHDAAINPGNSGGPLISDCGMVVGVNTGGARASQGIFLASRITEAVPELRALGLSVATADARCAEDEATAAREAAEAAAGAAAEAARVAAGAVTEAREVAASAAAEAAGSAVEAAERRIEATEDRVALALWITLGMGAVLFPAIALLTMREPRREVVRVVERASNKARDRGANRASGLYLPFRYFAPGRGWARGRAEAALPDLRFVRDPSGPDSAPIDIRVDGRGLRAADGGFVIGRASDLADGIVADPAVSRRHARVVRKGGRFFIEDLDSREGTWVDGERLAPFTPHRIEPGAEVRFGAGPPITLRRAGGGTSR